MTRSRWIVAAFAAAGLALVMIAVLRWSPHVPADAASTPLARTLLTGEVAPDASAGADVNQGLAAPFGQACLPRISNATGVLDVCWEAHRYPSDADPGKDYYILRVFGTIGPGSSGTPRWAILKAALEGSPADRVFSTWPDGALDGSCESVPVTLGLALPDMQETICGHITGSAAGQWAHAVTWTCVGCLLPNDRDRSLSLYEAVGVPEGTIPVWQVFADVGG